MIKNVIFDIGSVIAYFKQDKVLSEFTSDKEEQKFIAEEVINSPEWTKYGLIDTGFLPLESMGKIICDRTNHIHDDLVMDFAVNHVTHLEVQESILNLITKLKNNGYNVYILSNTNESCVKYMSKTGMFDLVDGYVLSYEVGMVKPYQGIYKELLNKYNLVPNESLFLDDLEANINTARELGINGEVVEKNSYDSVIEALEKHNINFN